MFDFDVSIIQANFIIRDIAFRLYNFIIKLFLELLDIIKVFVINNH